MTSYVILFYASCFYWGLLVPQISCRRTQSDCKLNLHFGTYSFRQ